MNELPGKRVQTLFSKADLKKIKSKLLNQACWLWDGYCEIFTTTSCEGMLFGTLHAPLCVMDEMADVFF